MRWESNLCVGKGELHQFHRGPCAACPSTSPSWWWGTSQGTPEELGWQTLSQPRFRCAQQERAWKRKVLGVQPQQLHPKMSIQRVGLSPVLIPLDAKKEVRKNPGWKQRVDSRLRICNPDCKNGILQGLLGFRALTWFTKNFGIVSWLCITFLALILGWGWVHKRC